MVILFTAVPTAADADSGRQYTHDKNLVISEIQQSPHVKVSLPVVSLTPSWPQSENTEWKMPEINDS